MYSYIIIQSAGICFYRWSVYTSFENNRSKLFSEILSPFIWISSLLSNGRQSASQSVITTLLGCRIGLLNVKTKDKHDDGEWSLDTSTHRVGDGHLEIIRSNLMIQMVENFFLNTNNFSLLYNYLPYNESVTLHLKKLEYFSPDNAFGKDWLKYSVGFRKDE